MITLVDHKTAMGYTEENAPKNNPNLISIEEALDLSMSIILWQEDDGDGNAVTVEAHHEGFMIWTYGDNHANAAEIKKERGAIGTWLSFTMLEEMRAVMEEHKHLIRGNGEFIKQ